MSKGSDMWSCKYKNNAEGTILRMLCTMLRLAITFRMHAGPLDPTRAIPGDLYAEAKTV